VTKEEALAKLRGLHGHDDVEHAHSVADDVLLDLIDDDEIRDAYEAVPKWYS